MTRNPASCIHVGTSGWVYPDWKVRFYPAGVKDTERLAYYISQFDALEINATFYRLPTRAMTAAWSRLFPPDFKLVAKGAREITHLMRLRQPEAALTPFLTSLAALPSLQVVLWQLPPSLACDLPLLGDFLSLLRRTSGGLRSAFEFRHPTWWDDKVYDLLARFDAAFTALSHPSLPDDIPVTTDFIYARFHGLGPTMYDYTYNESELAEWARRLTHACARRTLFAFFNNTFRAQAVGNARTLRALLKTLESQPGTDRIGAESTSRSARSAHDTTMSSSQR